jgi:hypothetical protein
LNPVVADQIKIDLKAGKSPRSIYRQAVRNADNPLDTSAVPSVEQIKYLNMQVQKQLYPFEEVLKTLYY